MFHQVFDERWKREGGTYEEILFEKIETLAKTIICLSLCFVLFAAGLTAQAQSPAPASWNLTFDTNDILTASKEACLIFSGGGYWEKAQVQTLGCVLLEQKETNGLIEVSLYTVRSVFDTSTGVPNQIAGGCKPVKLTFVREMDALRLIDYEVPEDGEANGSSKRSIFGEALGMDIIKREFEYMALAEQDAIADAHAYMRFCQTGEADGVWHAFLHNGSESKAQEIIRAAIHGNYPYCSGEISPYPYDDRLYTLSVEGEQSHSGILTFCCYDANGNRELYCKVQVRNGEIQVLDGKLP